MPTPMHANSISRASGRRARCACCRALAFNLVLVLALLLVACGRFPRNNPVEQSAEGSFALARSEEALIVGDSPGASPFNNGNGIAEPRETVQLTVPIDAMHVSTMLTARVSVEDLNDGRCASSVTERGAAGSQLQPLVLPPTAGDAPSPLSVGTVEVILGADGCDPATPLELALRFRIVERPELAAIVVPFQVDVAALSGEVSLDEVVIDDDATDGQRDADPGETVLLFPAIENTGDDLLRGVSLGVQEEGRVCVEDVRIRQSRSGRIELSDLSPGQVVTGGAGSIELTVAADCDTDAIELVFDVRDASEQRWSLPWSTPIVPIDAGADESDAGDDGATE